MSQKGALPKNAGGNIVRMTTRQQTSKIPRSQCSQGGIQTTSRLKPGSNIETEQRNKQATQKTGQARQDAEHTASNTHGIQSATSNRNNEETVVLELVDLEAKEPSHPVQVGRILDEEGFQAFTDVRKLGKFRFRLETNDPCALKKLILVKHNLRVWEAKLKDHVICFVRRVPEMLGDEELIKVMEADAEVIKVERIKAWNRQKELMDTPNLKVTFKGTTVPDAVKIYGCCFRCELYVFPVRQCEKCWRFGHGTKFCTYRRAKCKSCGGENCKNGCIGITKCVNCQREHRANSKDCPERKRRQRILQVMRKNNKTYTEAEQLYPKLTNRFNILDEEEFPGLEDIPTPCGPRTFSPRLRRSRSSGSVQRTEAPPRSTTHIETQPNTQCRCVENTLKATDLERFLHKLRQDLISEIRARHWLKPLMELQSKIIQNVQAAKSDLDKDRIIIEIGNDIRDLIEANSHQPTYETRITTACNSGV